MCAFFTAQERCEGLQGELARARERASAEASLAAETASRARAQAEEMGEDLELAHAELEVTYSPCMTQHAPVR
jgi:multidrug resistance efflux pump